MPHSCTYIYFGSIIVFMLKKWRSLVIFSLLLLILIFAQKGVLAQERKFLDLNLQFLDEYELS